MLPVRIGGALKYKKIYININVLQSAQFKWKSMENKQQQMEHVDFFQVKRKIKTSANVYFNISKLYTNKQ